MREHPVRARLRQWIANVASIIEIVISVMVLIAIGIAGVRIAGEVLELAGTADVSGRFSDFLNHAFTLIIGVEFIKMLAKHTPGSAIEVLLVAIARQMVVEHSTPVENLLGILAILLLFVIRKYLFVPSFGEHPPAGAQPPGKNGDG